MFIYLNKKAQSTAEYVIILGLVVGAVVAMQTYVKRGLQGRVREAVDHVGPAAPGNINPAFTGDQYEPYYLSSQFNTIRDSRVNEVLRQDGEVFRDTQVDNSNRDGNQTIAGDRHGAAIND